MITESDMTSHFKNTLREPSLQSSPRKLAWYLVLQHPGLTGGKNYQGKNPANVRNLEEFNQGYTYYK